VEISATDCCRKNLGERVIHAGTIGSGSWRTFQLDGEGSIPVNKRRNKRILRREKEEGSSDTFGGGKDPKENVSEQK